jgi:carbamoyltransferase
MAASVQQVLEEALLRLVVSCHEAKGSDALCLAGGVALNCVANSRLATETPFKRFSIQPAAGDGGGALGAALYVSYAEHPELPRAAGHHSTLLGPSFHDDTIRAFLDEAGASYERLSEDDLCRRTAELIHQNQIVGWFQGRMEFGPRALGSRSILANPCNPAMKEILNSRVKFREDLRPFAPAVLADRAPEFFDLPYDSPYMLFMVPVKDSQRGRLPSVTHIDGTARVQTVQRDENPRFHRLLEAFDALTGVPIIINTSFNIRGEPIVCTPDDAYTCFQKTDIDFLVMGDCLVSKEW